MYVIFFWVILGFEWKVYIVQFYHFGKVIVIIGYTGNSAAPNNVIAIFRMKYVQAIEIMLFKIFSF